MGVQVIIDDPLPKNINPKNVIKNTLNLIPKHLSSGVDKIYMGQYEKLIKRNLQALYSAKTSSIYVSNEQHSEMDIIDDIVHEFAHSVEGMYNNQIYADKEIEKEFIVKRRRMWEKLKRIDPKIKLDTFLNVEYSRAFDEYLYKKIGYTTLGLITSDIFYSPYAATSLREYFANGFEAFFVQKDVNRLKRVSPFLYKKIEELLTIDEV